MSAVIEIPEGFIETLQESLYTEDELVHVRGRGSKHIAKILWYNDLSPSEKAFVETLPIAKHLHYLGGICVKLKEYDGLMEDQSYRFVVEVGREANQYQFEYVVLILTKGGCRVSGVRHSPEVVDPREMW